MTCLIKLFKTGAKNKVLGTSRLGSSGNGNTDDRNKLNGSGWTGGLHEDVAKKIHEGLNLDPAKKRCHSCKREIDCGNYRKFMGMFYHQQCFRCHTCGRPITEHEYTSSEGNAYHNPCFTRPKCDVCLESIPVNGAGSVDIRCHPFWSQKYCPSHERDNTAKCCSCGRLESWNARYVSLGDGRSICFECMESAIRDTEDCLPLYYAIRDFYEVLDMKIEQQFPILLVDKQDLNEPIKGEKHGFHHMSETKGFCLCEKGTITKVMKTQPQKAITSEVIVIFVLHGLPRLLTGAILAHELMHGWLRLNCYRNPRPDVEEGICEVLSHMWLEHEMMSAGSMKSSKQGRRSSKEKKLGEFFLHQIAHDDSPEYGGGYRAARVAINKYGFRRTLDHIRFTGVLPE